MLGRQTNELAVPGAVTGDPSAVEISRIWIIGGEQHVALRADVWEDPAAWGLLLVDLAKHVANAYQQSEGRDVGATLQRIRAGFDAEWTQATGNPTGRLE